MRGASGSLRLQTLLLPSTLATRRRLPRVWLTSVDQAAQVAHARFDGGVIYRPCVSTSSPLLFSSIFVPCLCL